MKIFANEFKATELNEDSKRAKIQVKATPSSIEQDFSDKMSKTPDIHKHAATPDNHDLLANDPPSIFRQIENPGRDQFNKKM